MLVVAPADRARDRAGAASRLAGRRRHLRGADRPAPARSDADLAACEADIAGWLAYQRRPVRALGPRRPFTAFVWGPGGAWSTTGPPPRRSAPSSTRCSTAGSGGASSRPGPATAGSTRRGPAGRPPAAGRRRARFADERARPRRAAGRALPAAPVEPLHPGRVLPGGRPALRRAGPPPRRRRPAALGHGAWYRANAGGLVTTDGLAGPPRPAGPASTSAPGGPLRPRPE